MLKAGARAAVLVGITRPAGSSPPLLGLGPATAAHSDKYKSRIILLRASYPGPAATSFPTTHPSPVALCAGPTKCDSYHPSPD